MTHKLEQHLSKKLKEAGHEPPHGPATSSMMETIKSTIRNHETGTKVRDSHMGYMGDIHAHDDVRHLADKAHSAISEIHGSHRDGHDVMSSELIRHQLKHIRGGGKME